MTLQQLENNSPLSCEEWLEVAHMAGITNIDRNTELTSDQIRAMSDKIPEYVMRGKTQTEPTSEQAAQKEEAEKSETPNPSADHHPTEPIQNAPSQPSQPKPAKKANRAEKGAQHSLEKYVKLDRIYIDLSSILVPNAGDFLSHIQPFLQTYSKKVFLPISVLNRLIEKQHDNTDPEAAQRSHKILEELVSLCKAGFLEKEPNEDIVSKESVSPSRDLFTLCSQYRMKEPVLVVTQDEDLARNLMDLNQQNSVKWGKPVIVKRINRYGYLSDVIEPFTSKLHLATKPRNEPDKQLPMTVVPESNDTVYATPDCKTPIRLEAEIGSGGEGTIYRTETPYIAKIYKPECCTAHRLEKLQLMIDAKLKCEGICFPMGLLYNQCGQFVGYMMPEAQGYSIQSSIFRKPLFLRKLPNWKKEDLVQCTLTILQKIQYLHNNNILIGDINPNNILIVSPTEVYFVDTDSYQVNDLPCPVGVPLFTAPELHQKQRDGELHDYGDIMRTKENEYFAVATLVFMMMMPGKPPYTQQGGEDIVDNILGMHFPYALGERSSENVPDGTWRFIWSHLSRRMKEKFHAVFDATEGKSKYNVKERLTVDQWITELKEYLKTLRRWDEELQEFCTANNCTAEDVEMCRISGCEVDPQTLSLYPNRFKRQRGETYAKCRQCGKESPEKWLKAGFCSDCLKLGEEVTCIVDGTKFTFTNYEKYYKKHRKPTMCPQCWSRREEVYTTYDCGNPNCYNKVIVTIGQYANNTEKGWSLPKYCPDCKKLKDAGQLYTRNNYNTSANRNNYGNNYSNNHTSYSNNSNNSTPPKKKSSGCFITTAVCEYMGKADNCQELTDFRAFRDNWLRYQPGGEEQIQEYYACAPELVQRMHESPDYEEICNALWNGYLIPCQQMIQAEQYEACRERYTAMVDYLRNTLKA